MHNSAHLNLLGTVHNGPRHQRRFANKHSRRQGMHRRHLRIVLGPIVQHNKEAGASLRMANVV